MSDLISVYYYDCVDIIVLGLNKKVVALHRLLVFKDQGIISGQRHVEVSSGFGI